jgi:uncharacterized membrane protein YjjP (DUF1212 family)
MPNIEETPVKLGDGLHDTLKKYSIVQDHHEDRLDGHDLTLQSHANDIKQLKENNLRLENVVMAENRVTRETVTNTNKELHDLIKSLLGYKTGEQQQQVQLTQINNDLKLARYESWAKIIGILGSSGGFLFYLFGWK